jgi:hypothetical protein
MMGMRGGPWPGGPDLVLVSSAGCCVHVVGGAGGWMEAGREAGREAGHAACNEGRAACCMLRAEWIRIGFPQLGDDEVVASTGARGRRHRGRAHGFLSMGALSVIQTAWEKVWRSGGSMQHI